MNRGAKFLTVILLSSLVCGCAEKKSSDVSQDTDVQTLADADSQSAADDNSHQSVDESFGAIDTSVDNESDESDSAEFSEDDSEGLSEQRDHAGSGELRVPKKSKSKTPPKNPTEDDIGVEGDDTWYIKVNWSVFPNFEKHKGENIEFKVNNLKLSFGRTLGEVYEYAAKKGWGCLQDWERAEHFRSEPGEEVTIGFTNDKGQNVLTVRAFQPHTENTCEVKDFVVYWYNVAVDYVDDFNFLNMGEDISIYDMQYMQNATQFPTLIDSAYVFTEVETGLGKVGFYDNGDEYNYLSGFYYELSDEEKEKLIIED